MKKRPNIIVFMTDQQNADTVRSESPAKTPNIDIFRNEAISFENGYTVSPHCCPSRAAFFSGLYPSESGVWNNVEVDNALSRGLYDGVTLFPELLSKAGYETTFTGKWHVDATLGPADKGFQNVLFEATTNWGRFPRENKPRHTAWDQQYNRKENIKLDSSKEFGEIVHEGYTKYHQFSISEDPFVDRITVEKAISYLDEKNDDKPFFLYVGPQGPHDPYIPPQKFLDMYKDTEFSLPESFDDDMMDKPALYRRTRECFKLTREEHIESLRRYYAFVSYEDYLFGELLKKIREKGIWEDTYILYLSDHGDYIANHGLWAKGLPCFKEAYRIPCMIGGGDIKKEEHRTEFISLTDFAPTFLEMAGIETDLKFHGRSFAPIIDGNTPEGWREYHYTQTNGNEIYGIQRAVWNDKWKFVWNTFDYDELYDLENDPDEITNLAGKPGYEDIKKDMMKRIWLFAKKTQDNCTCPYIMVRLADYGPGIIFED